MTLENEKAVEYKFKRAEGYFGDLIKTLNNKDLSDLKKIREILKKIEVLKNDVQYELTDFVPESQIVFHTDVYYNNKELWYTLPVNDERMKESDWRCFIKNKDPEKKIEKTYKNVVLVFYENDEIEIYKDYSYGDKPLDKLTVDREKQDIDDITEYSSDTMFLSEKEKKLFVDGYKKGWWAARARMMNAVEDYRNTFPC